MKGMSSKWFLLMLYEAREAAHRGTRCPFCVSADWNIPLNEELSKCTACPFTQIINDDGFCVHRGKMMLLQYEKECEL